MGATAADHTMQQSVMYELSSSKHNNSVKHLSLRRALCRMTLSMMQGVMAAFFGVWGIAPIASKVCVGRLFGVTPCERFVGPGDRS